MKRLLSVSVVLVVLMMMTTTIWANQVVNGGFETGVIDCNSAPPSWTGYGDPMYRFTADSGCPGAAGESAHAGVGWAGEVSSYGTKSGGLLQQVGVCPGLGGSFSCWYRTFDTQSGNNSNAQVRLGYDLTGGTDPYSGSIIWTAWSSTPAASWTQLTTGTDTSTNAVVSVFIEYRVQFAYSYSLAFADDAAVAGGWVDDAGACQGNPPTVSSITPADSQPLARTDQLINYMLADDESNPAQLAAEYRYGDGFNEFMLPDYYQFPFGGVNGPSTPSGGVGTGAWKIKGNAGTFWWLGSPPSVTNPVAVMVNQAYGHANEELVMEIQVTYWDRTATQFKPPEDREGVGIFIASSDFSEYFCLGSLDDVGNPPAGNVIETRAFWHILSASPVEGMSPDYIPNLGSVINHDTNAIQVTYRITRTATELSADMRVADNAFSNKDVLTVAGTALGIDHDLKIGVFVNEPVETCIDWFASPYQACTMGAGGDGTTGLTTSPGATAHDYSWAVGTDMAQHPGANNHLFTQMRMAGTDTHGQGANTDSAWVEIQGDSVVTPTPTPGCTYHDSDYGPQNWQLSIFGVQLLIQRFNTGGNYHCGTPGVQDGYAPGTGDQSCSPHSADYNNNWLMDLLEVQRCVQFFNVGSYHCQPGTVDGYAPGPDVRR